MANYHYMSLHQAWVTNQKLVNIYGVITRVDIPGRAPGRTTSKGLGHDESALRQSASERGADATKRRGR